MVGRLSSFIRVHLRSSVVKDQRFVCGSAASGPFVVKDPGSGLRIPVPMAETSINPPRRNRRGYTSGLAIIRADSRATSPFPVFVSFVYFVVQQIPLVAAPPR
jgi:hypothetical protein